MQQKNIYCICNENVLQYNHPKRDGEKIVETQWDMD